MTDTTHEAVERARQTLRAWYAATANDHADAVDLHSAEQMLAALLAERDAAVARAERWDTEAAASKAAMARLEAERDAARAEAERMRRGWLVTIQAENSCPATGNGCLAKRCGCVAEMEMLMREDDERAAKQPGHE